MPELPEVETVKNGLLRHVVGKTIADVSFEEQKSFQISQDKVVKNMLGASIKTIRRRGKMLYIDLSTKNTIIVHLKMTGQLIYNGGKRFGGGHPNDSLVGHLPDSSTRVEMTFNDGSKLFFNDQRKFGWIRLVQTSKVKHLPYVKRIGPEPFDNKFKPHDLVNRLRQRPNSQIKAALLDQSVVAGIGNIYADETLWLCRINPMSRIYLLSDAKLQAILPAARRIMKQAIDSGGSTDKNYVNAEGKKGSYLQFAQVFRRDSQPCPRCGRPIKKIRVAGRGTHYCSYCQRLPKGQSS